MEFTVQQPICSLFVANPLTTLQYRRMNKYLLKIFNNIYLMFTVKFELLGIQ